MKTIGFECHHCGCGHSIWLGQVPQSLRFNSHKFEDLWQLHPEKRDTIRMPGGPVTLPRWQQAYGRDYEFSRQVSKALPIPALLEPLLLWSRESIEEALNGILVNWYDGSLDDYIGPHRDSTNGLVVGTSIVTISLGEERIFRLRPSPAKGGPQRIDLLVADGSVLIMPYETNLAFKHEVPHFSKYRGRRISVTIRAFIDQ